MAARLVLPLGLANPAFAVDYPSSDDVQAARQNQAAASTSAGIEGFLVTLETESAELGRAAQIRGESYSLAREALGEASIRADRLEARAQDATRWLIAPASGPRSSSRNSPAPAADTSA